MINSVPLVIRTLQENRNALLAREDMQLQRMAKAWLQIERSLHSDMELLAYQIEDAKAEGKAVTEQLLRKQKLYQLLDKKLEEQVLKYSKTTAASDISAEQAAYAEAGVQGAVAAIKTSYINMVPSFSVLSPTAFETMVGLLGDGTPLYRLLKQAYPDALDGIVKGLLQGVARGIGPNQTAKEMAQGMGMGLQRITLIARTEQLRMWRIATAQQYQESKVVERSKRLCMKDERTCLGCLMLDGQLIPLNETLSDHPRGRCTSVPVVTGAPEITWELGKDWFLKQPEKVQRDMMGNAMYQLWREKKFDLSDLAGIHHNDKWGDSPYAKTYKEIKAEKEV